MSPVASYLPNGAVYDIHVSIKNVIVIKVLKKMKSVHPILQSVVLCQCGFIEENIFSQPKVQNLDLKCNICLSQFADQLFYRLLDVLYALWAVSFIFTHQVIRYNPLTQTPTAGFCI